MHLEHSLERTGKERSYPKFSWSRKMYTEITKGGREDVMVEDIPGADEENNVKKSLVFNFRKYNRLSECPEEEQRVNIS